MGKIVLFIVSILVYQFWFVVINAELITYVNIGCTDTGLNYTSGDQLQKNINFLLNNLASESSSLKFYNSSAGDNPIQVYGLFQCRYDVGPDICSLCVRDATQRIVENCPLFGEATIWYYECMLRYSNRSNIFTDYETRPSAYRWSNTNVSNYDDFAPVLANETKNVIDKASKSMLRYGSGETHFTLFQSLYSFAQCIPGIGTLGCQKCLNDALQDMILYCNKSVFAMIFYPSCQLRYDTINPILNDESTIMAPPPALPPLLDQAPGQSKATSLKPGIIATIAICALAGLIGLAVVLWIFLSRKKLKEESRELPPSSPKGDLYTVQSDAESFGDVEFVQYDFTTLQMATKNFSAESKLGEGGFGIVYKGTLENGQQVAIKRLSGTSGQGNREFMNEARFLAKLQHRNLVRLVGSCSDADEKLLVYEFMPNSSLDRFLFDPKKRPLLDWGKRYRIIMGIARGLQYLHEDSRLTIIHRDLKPGNILLDRQMNSKIADFGMAKLFGGEQKRGETSRIIGTHGYMAPEYIMTGEYSEKSDVYSFGIMLLEIVSGQKNRIFYPSQRNEDLPVHIWRLWNEGRSFDITDPALYNNCSSNDVIRCIQIGLLCVQAEAKQRPTMTSVVLMLTGSVDLPVPSAPTLLSHQFSMTNSHNGENDLDSSSAKTVTWRTELDQDLYPRPR
ncbi:hypothetical protein RND81_07G128000 [Saponaria officinalis]|uniref:Uncharacterized protein n=1 Tax=Saponaria officinalis TaxID=3572 RepID=A0AAW1JRL7_SAPOF